MAPLRVLCFSFLLIFGLAGCDQINEQLNKQKAVGKAIGAGCRQSGRSLEDCYNRNPKVSKPDIFTGWKEMSEYMQKQKLEVIPPPPDAPKDESAAEDANASEPAAGHASAVASAASAIGASKPAEKPAAKAPTKH